MVLHKNPKTIEKTPVEIKTRGPHAIPPWEDQWVPRRGLRPRTPGKGLPSFAILWIWYRRAPEGDIIALR